MTKAVISFTHTNYCIRSAGTEKFVRDFSKLLQTNSYAHLNFFSFYDDNNQMKSKMVGVNYNDKFVGVYKYMDIKTIIDYLGKRNNLKFVAIHFEHLLHHDLIVLKDMVNVMKISVYIFIHDYYLICPKLKLIDTNKNFCGIISPSMEKCKSCAYREQAIIHKRDVEKFLLAISLYIGYIITPSDYVTQQIKTVFTLYADRIVTRPHVVTYGEKTFKKIGKKVRIAFAGGQFQEKGYGYWKELVKDLMILCPEDNEFYYLGSGNEKLESVKDLYVSSTKQNENMMIDSLEEYNIDCAFLWPLCAETYSYVYYELSVSGVFNLTNSISGNICCEIEKNKNGKVFETYTNCLEWLSNVNEVRNEINRYRFEEKFCPEGFINNGDMSYLVSNERSYNPTVKGEVHPNFFYTMIYRAKYRGDLK